jgi:hypothetical protein
LLHPLFEDFTVTNLELVLLMNKIKWNFFEKELGIYYLYRGAQGVFIQMTVVFFFLKHLYYVRDECLSKHSVLNVYF